MTSEHYPSYLNPDGDPTVLETEYDANLFWILLLVFFLIGIAMFIGLILAACFWDVEKPKKFEIQLRERQNGDFKVKNTRGKPVTYDGMRGG